MKEDRRSMMPIVPIIAGAAAAQTQAIKASGITVRVTPSDFERILKRIENPLVITAKGGFLGNRYRYLTSYRGFAFFTQSKSSLQLPEGTETIQAGEIWIPQ
jgi:hypothetical protein